MISVNELKRWLAGLRDDDFVGMDEDSLTLYTTDGNASIEIGGSANRDRRSAKGGRMKWLGIKTYLPGARARLLTSNLRD